MLDINLFRNNPELVKGSLKRRKDNEKLDWVDKIIKLDKEWRELKVKLDSLRNERNKVSTKINQLKKEGKDVASLIKIASSLPSKIQKTEQVIKDLKNKLDSYLMRMPNILHPDVPYGKDDSENVEVRRWGKLRTFDFDIKNHVELAEGLGMVDFDRSAKISGNGFYILLDKLALLEQALSRFALDILLKKGFKLILPPYMMRRKPYEGVTDLEDFKDVMYKIENEDEYLIATSEHPIGAMYMNETIDVDKLPLKFVGYSTCFRKEVGSHGIDTKGLFRVHQFNKVEQFIFSKPEESWQIHEELILNIEEIFKKLNLPYRVVNICTGDIGIVAAKKYDLEVWMPRQNKYAEAGSCSNCTDYQARRLKIFYGKHGGNKELVHTLNSTAIATSRALVAILENYQNEDGTLTVPEVLQPYMNGLKLIEPLDK